MGLILWLDGNEKFLKMHKKHEIEAIKRKFSKIYEKIHARKVICDSCFLLIGLHLFAPCAFSVVKSVITRAEAMKCFEAQRERVTERLCGREIYPANVCSTRELQ